ncbi:MAG: M23 family metallopeptidase [Verrucomicrobia bacterium]|nr:M23 family metallopeptidase [Verrucomicrobiota bacterium]
MSRLRPALLLWLCAAALHAQPFYFPTANRSLFDKGGEEGFFTGTVGKPWMSGTFGCVRTDGRQMHEGLDIRCLQHDKRGEPTDPVLAAADGTVAYFNKKSGLSNYGNYLVLRHVIDGLEVFTLYAHLREIRDDLKAGAAVRAGERIATMGRTTNTREGISRDRAHVHFEINLFVSERFDAWYKKFHPGERNDHGIWNGQNLLGFDPWEVFREEVRLGKNFNLVNHLRAQTELCRVFIRESKLPLATRLAALVIPNPRADAEGVAGYEIALNFNGVPFQLIPRSATEMKSKARLQLLSVNDAEQSRNGCRKLLTKRGTRWELSSHGQQHVELLGY